MSELEEIERDLREYLEKEPNLRKADKLVYLTAIFHKRLEIRKLDHVVSYADYFSILGQAKNFYIRMKLPVRISGKELEANDALHVSTLESFIGYLNRNNLLKKLIKFDYTE
jgi:hypothetical protein